MLWPLLVMSLEAKGSYFSNIYYSGDAFRCMTEVIKVVVTFITSVMHRNCTELALQTARYTVYCNEYIVKAQRRKGFLS